MVVLIMVHSFYLSIMNLLFLDLFPASEAFQTIQAATNVSSCYKGEMLVAA